MSMAIDTWSSVKGKPEAAARSVAQGPGEDLSVAPLDVPEENKLRQRRGKMGLNLPPGMPPGEGGFWGMTRKIPRSRFS